MAKKIVPAFLYCCIGSATKFSEQYQSWYCSKCGKWLTPKNCECGGYDCGYPTDRPMNIYDPGNGKVVFDDKNYGVIKLKCYG